MSTAAKKALGRGLASLIPDSALDSAIPGTSDRSNLRMVPIDEIKSNPHQPREVFATADIEALSNSIRQHGVLQPLVVRRDDGRYFLVAGERRLRAAALAGLREVPVIVRDVDEPSEQLELALVENLQRTDLDPIEAAKGYQKLIETHSWTQEEVARRVGKDRATIANAIRLLKLPESALVALRDGKISAGHARAMLPVGDKDAILGLVDRVSTEGLSVRDVERIVNKLVAPEPPVRFREPADKRFDYANRTLSDFLHTSVKIKPRRDGSGSIVIDFADGEDMERLLAVIRGDF